MIVRFFTTRGLQINGNFGIATTVYVLLSALPHYFNCRMLKVLKGGDDDDDKYGFNLLYFRRFWNLQKSLFPAFCSDSAALLSILVSVLYNLSSTSLTLRRNKLECLLLSSHFPAGKIFASNVYSRPWFHV
jgi:hypothetical protein